jgi:methyl coenzyme M reductase beta subunit
MNHQHNFESEAKFHEALAYLCNRYEGFQSKDLKHILQTMNISAYQELFERQKCYRLLRYIGEMTKRFTNGKLYQSITFNGATYEIVDDTGKVALIGCMAFECVDEIENMEILK